MTKLEKTENFIKKAKEIHGNKVDYSKTSYPLVNKRLTFICPIHGEFTQIPAEHLKSKTPCPICGNRIINTKIFIEKARKVHGDKYDYSKVGDITSSKDIVTIICPKHGEFPQEVNSHLQGRGCAKCSGKKFCLEDYIEKANKVWNNKYDYSKFKWKGIYEPVCIICPEHGEFWQLPNNHLKGECGCLECRGKSKDFKQLDSLDELIKRSKEKYGNKFDFSKSVWKGSREPIDIICPEHGKFSTLPRQFLLNKYGCPKCRSNLKYTTESYIEECKKTHPNLNYDYSRTVYTYSTDPVTIICLKHGEFYPLASQFISEGTQCPECVKESYRLGKEEFIKRAREVHGDYYNYDKVNYINNNTLVTITCPIHGDFEQFPTNHLKGCGCKKCALEKLTPSKGEEIIINFLESHNIKYKFQYEITTKTIARNSNIILIDFVVKINGHIYFIEYNGKQHYEYISFFHKGGIIDFEKQQRRDNLLRQLCEVHKDKITLIEIKYDMKVDEIEEKLKNILGV